MQTIERLESRIAPATFVVTSLDDSGAGSLRDAVAQANDHAGADTIVFAKKLEGIILLSSGQIQITDTLAIKGPGAGKLVIDAELKSRIFSVTDFDPNKDSPLSVSGLSFLQGKQNNADSSGGAIASLESLKVKNCVFLRNEANSTDGGAIFVKNEPGLSDLPISVDIRNSSFFQNRNFDGSGGAVSVQVKGDIGLRNNLFTENFAHDAGGGVFLQAGVNRVLLLENCEFDGNAADQDGGAFLDGDGFGAEGDSQIIVRGCGFSHNMSEATFAGGLGIDGGKVLIEKSLFTHNESSDAGGGLSARAFRSLTIRASQFLNNEALPNSFEQAGGGIFLDMADDSITRIIATTIAANTAIAGGGIFVDGGLGRVELIGSKVLGNTASLGGGGIAVESEAGTGNGADLRIFQSKLSGNVSETGPGGAIFHAGGGAFTMEFSQVTQNQAADNGGGLALGLVDPATIVGSVIARNSGGLAGGGIATQAVLSLINTRIIGNSADNGGGILAFDDLELTGCIVSGNLAGSAGGIFQKSFTNLALKKTKVADNVSIGNAQISQF